MELHERRVLVVDRSGIRRRAGGGALGPPPPPPPPPHAGVRRETAVANIEAAGRWEPLTSDCSSLPAGTVGGGGGGGDGRGVQLKLEQLQVCRASAPFAGIHRYYILGKMPDLISLTAITTGVESLNC